MRGASPCRAPLSAPSPASTQPGGAARADAATRTARVEAASSCSASRTSAVLRARTLAAVGDSGDHRRHSRRATGPSASASPCAGPDASMRVAIRNLPAGQSGWPAAPGPPAPATAATAAANRIATGRPPPSAPSTSRSDDAWPAGSRHAGSVARRAGPQQFGDSLEPLPVRDQAEHVPAPVPDRAVGHGAHPGGDHQVNAGARRGSVLGLDRRARSSSSSES